MIADSNVVQKSFGESFLFKADTSTGEIESVVWNSLRSGNRKALDFIFEKYVRLLSAYGSKISKDQGLVEDCIQDLFVELWNRRESLSETTSIKFYLLKSIRRRIVRRIVSDTRSLEISGGDNDREEVSVEFNIIQEQTLGELNQQLSKALAHLSGRQREAIYLRFYEKMDYSQISDVMNLSLKSSYKLMGKAIDTLRKALR